MQVSTSGQYDYFSLCNVQDAMFQALSETFRVGDHVLQSLDVRIYTPGEDEDWLGVFS